jgi:hypothetical protein
LLAAAAEQIASRACLELGDSFDCDPMFALQAAAALLRTLALGVLTLGVAPVALPGTVETGAAGELDVLWAPPQPAMSPTTSSEATSQRRGAAIASQDI